MLPELSEVKEEKGRGKAASTSFFILVSSFKVFWNLSLWWPKRLTPNYKPLLEYFLYQRWARNTEAPRTCSCLFPFLSWFQISTLERVQVEINQQLQCERGRMIRRKKKEKEENKKNPWHKASLTVLLRRYNTVCSSAIASSDQSQGTWKVPPS